MMDDATNAIAMIRPDGFQRLVSRMEKNEPIFYASRQKRLVGLVGGGGTLWLVTSLGQKGLPRSYRLACKLTDCSEAEPPEEYKRFGRYAIRAGEAFLLPDNDATATLLKLRFESGKPIANRSNIGQALLAIRQLDTNDVALLETFYSTISAPREEIVLSPSVDGVVNSLRAKSSVTAWDIVQTLLGRHSEYGGGQASMLSSESGPTAGVSKPVGEWIEKAKARLDTTIVKELHGRLLILALARVDEDLHRYLQRGDFLQKVESELREPVDRLFLAPGDAAPLHVDGPEKKDRLGREAFARSLAARLRRIWQDYSQEAESSFILHLHGPWGAGKTTLLRLLRKELAPETDVVRQDKKTAILELLRKVLRRKTNVARQDESRWIVVEFNA